MGTPKALLRDAHGVPFLDRAVGRLLDGGCAAVTVVLGASADEARALLDEAGLGGRPRRRGRGGRRLGRGHGRLAARRPRGACRRRRRDVTAALVSLVDLPDVDDAVVRPCAGRRRADPEALARATYDGQPGTRC